MIGVRSSWLNPLSLAPLITCYIFIQRSGKLFFICPTECSLWWMHELEKSLINILAIPCQKTEFSFDLCLEICNSSLRPLGGRRPIPRYLDREFSKDWRGVYHNVIKSSQQGDEEDTFSNISASRMNLVCVIGITSTGVSQEPGTIITAYWYSAGSTSRRK